MTSSLAWEAVGLCTPWAVELREWSLLRRDTCEAWGKLHLNLRRDTSPRARGHCPLLASQAALPGLQMHRGCTYIGDWVSCAFALLTIKRLSGYWEGSGAEQTRREHTRACNSFLSAQLSVRPSSPCQCHFICCWGGDRITIKSTSSRH